MQRRRILCRDLDRGELAETGVHAVNGIFARHGPSDAGMGVFDCGAAGGVEPHRCLFAVDAGQIVQSGRAGGEGQGGHDWPPKMRE